MRWQGLGEDGLLEEIGADSAEHLIERGLAAERYGQQQQEAKCWSGVSWHRS